MFGLKSPFASKNTRKIILHIGAPKCASSTLQTYLTTQFAQGQKIERSDAQTARYFVIQKSGRVLERDQITKAAASSSSGYAASAGLRENESVFEKAFATVLQKTSDTEIAILSCEGWFHHKFSEGMIDVFKRLNVEVEVFGVIRPPMDYFNSSWWQWGAWDDVSVPVFMTRTIPATFWHRHLKHWKNVPGVTRLEVVDLRGDVLGAFKTFLGAKDVWNERSNLGSSAALLDFLLTQPDYLGRGVHEPGIEFSINRFVPQPPCPKPFVMGPHLQQRLMNATKDSVHANRPYFSSEEKAEAHVNDPAYSSLEYYEGRVLRGMKNVAWPKERYKFRVAMSHYFHNNPWPEWMPKNFDLAAIDEEIRIGPKKFG